MSSALELPRNTSPANRLGRASPGQHERLKLLGQFGVSDNMGNQNKHASQLESDSFVSEQLLWTRLE
jgi:hypothetical protein